MNRLKRRPAPRRRVVLQVLILSGFLMGSLGGCQLIAPLGGPLGGSLGEAGNEPQNKSWPFTSSLAQLTPPPVPLRKPRPPGGFLAQNAVLRAAAETVISAPLNSAPITTQSLAPLRKPAVASSVVSSVASSPAPARAASLAVSANYRVQAGDTVYGVARRFAVPLRGVIDANGLRPPYALRVGQVLQVPNPRRHMVQAGDTVYGVARRYGAEPSQIVRLNRIAAPYTLAPGQKLTLPVPSRSGGGQALAKAAAPAPTRIAKTAKAVAIPAPPPRASGKFLWPVRGHTIAGYGRNKNGLHNDGINIAAPRGAPVRAADNGVVAYVGNELRGFGNLILVKHAGGWVTAYAHNQDFLVRRGQTVARGQKIARIGSSGNVATPQLHFEIRKGARSVDPTRYLGPQRAAAAS